MSSLTRFRTALCVAAAFGLSGLPVSSASAADTFDFVSMANSSEHGVALLGPLAGTGYTLSITGYDGSTQTYAYLDSGHGGLGVCPSLTGSAQCTPSSDDNVRAGEKLSFLFSSSVVIEEIWFNNNHDSDNSLLGDKIDIGGSTYTFLAGDSLAGGDWKYSTDSNVAAGSPFEISYNNEQFYVSKMLVSVNAIPEPETYAMLLAGLGLLGFAARRRKQKELAA